MLAKIFSRAAEGINTPAVNVEVHQSNGLPALNIVGLLEAAVRESKDRVRSALINSRFDFPARTIANLAGSEPVASPHVAEAVGYRVLDRQKGMN